MRAGRGARGLGQHCAVHGDALTTTILGTWPSLRAVVQLYPECMPLNTGLSAHAYAVMGHLAASKEACLC